MYITQSVSSINDLMDKLYAFCTNTASGYPAYTGLGITSEGTGKRFHIGRLDGNPYFFNFRSVSNEAILNGSNSYGIYMNAGIGNYESTLPWYNQESVLTYDNGTKYLITGMNKLDSSIVSCHFFYFKVTNNYDVIYVIVESPSGTYQRLMFGVMESSSLHSEWAGNPPVGLFYSGSVSHTNTNYSIATSFFGGSDSLWQSGSPIGAAYVNSQTEGGDYFTGWAIGDFSIPLNQFPEARPQIFDMSLKMNSIFLCSPNTFNSMPPLYPVTICSTTPRTTTMDGNAVWYPVGTLPFVYTLNMFNISSGASVTIGSDTYKVFPFRKKSDTWVSSSPDNGTYRFGFAIKTS